ncbi:hypothetical protein [Paenibacillus timonensis]|uniref:hypothetical protein n=1 Tax=Paenibacillus timonensis TaxID=225915 RepID=UPI003F99A138
MQTMYPAVVNSPKTELVVAITATDTEIEVTDVSVLLQPEGLAVIGNGEGAETIKYADVDGNILKDCIRGFQGTAKPWGAGTRLARNFTGYDHDVFKANIEQHETAITALEDRLDNADTDPVTLQPGLQVVNAAKDARFRLGVIKGRTLINLLGVAGDCENTSVFSASSATLSLDSTNKTQGINGIKITITADTGIMYYSPFKPGRYVLLADVKNGNATSVELKTNGTIAREAITETTTFKTTWIKFLAADETQNLEVLVRGTAGQNAFVDGLRLYELTETEYAALDSLTADQIAEKYPFVPSGIIGVENPYAIATSDNLLPPFYEWTSLGSSVKKIVAPYEMIIDQKAADGWQFVSCVVPVTANTEYRFECDHNAKISITNAEGTEVIVPYTEEKIIQFNSGEYAEISVYFSSIEIGQDVVYALASPLLTIGTKPKPFVPQRKSMLAMQTELHANPTDGSDPDVLFEQNGQYFKLAKWKKMLLDGVDPNVRFEGPVKYTGFTRVRLAMLKGVPLIPAISYLTKYDGKNIPRSILDPTKEYFSQSLDAPNGNYILVNISASDSGWGDAYTPTADEIKSYFMGWKMFTQGGASADPYNGTGTKAWVRIDKIGNATGYTSTTVPMVSWDGYTPYQLLYRLANETVEPVISEGALLFSEGDNMVEVGTGIVLRERAKPTKTTTNDGYYRINSNVSAVNDSALKHETNRIVQVYGNDRNDFKWTLFADVVGSNGGGVARIPYADFDPSASYSATYIKLDKSPIQPINGALAANEKAQISDLTTGVAEALQRVSVVEQMKAEKVEPDTDWIGPTLLNGSLQYSDTNSFNLIGYKRTSTGEVRLRGMITVPTAGAVVFTMLSGFRPKRTLIFPCSASGGVVEVRVYATGNVTIASTATWLSLESISFLVER